MSSKSRRLKTYVPPLSRVKRARRKYEGARPSLRFDDRRLKSFTRYKDLVVVSQHLIRNRDCCRVPVKSAPRNIVPSIVDFVALVESVPKRLSLHKSADVSLLIGGLANSFLLLFLDESILINPPHESEEEDGFFVSPNLLLNISFSFLRRATSSLNSRISALFLCLERNALSRFRSARL